MGVARTSHAEVAVRKAGRRLIEQRGAVREPVRLSPTRRYL